MVMILLVNNENVMKIELTAKKTFKDKNDPTVLYTVGSKLNLDDTERINDLVKRGLCDITSLEVEDQNDKVKFGEKEYDTKTMIAVLKQIDGVSVANNAGVENLNTKIAALTEDQIKALTEFLSKE